MRQQNISFPRSSWPVVTSVLSAGVILLAGLTQVAMSQQPTINVARPATAAVGSASETGYSTTASDDQYRIGPGDVLDIRVFDYPQLSRDAVRVNGRGGIEMPLLEGEIQAACRTESELAQDIANRYLKYQRNPQVEVFIKDYESQPVAVIGAVNTPGRFQLRRRVHLLELLTFAGGPAERAGRSIQVVHNAASLTCEKSASQDTPVGTEVTPTSYSLSATLRGDAKSNPYVQPGDIITLTDAEQIYVIGNVMRPSAIPLKEPMTVSRAIAIAGGTLRDKTSNRVRIVRQASASMSKIEIYVDLKAIDKHRAEDIALQANDIVDVPTATGFQVVMKDVFHTLVPTFTQFPLRVIR
jgi:polysaccharide export outer membrane protein